MKKWEWLPILSGLLFIAFAVGAAVRETPTVDEFAHVPAGLLHWRYANYHLYRNNPPLGKMWVAAPLALDSSIKVDSYAGTGVGFEPWYYGIKFEQSNRDRYLSFFYRSRLMTIPLVLLTSFLIYRWSRSLFGRFAGSMSSSLFLLSPTVLAHGHLATVDIASMHTIFAAVFAARWSAHRPTLFRMATAGFTLGLALAVKFSALFLEAVIPVVFIAMAWRGFSRAGARAWIGRLAIYGVTAWVTLNGSMGFQGTFDRIGSLEPRSKAIQSLKERLPASMPLMLPRDYVEGVDALEEDIEANYFPGYLHGQWSPNGWMSYYVIAYAIKESEPIVLLTLASLVTLLFARIGWRETITLITAPILLMLIASFANSLCLGVRYILPVFPFLFVQIGSVFALVERKMFSAGETSRGLSHPWLRDWRVWLSGPIIAYQVLLAFFVYPSYISYFNGFVGGSRNGANWLVDSNLDWGQDLYRLPAEAKRQGIDRWQLLYFGHVDPSLYGIDFDLASEEAKPGVYAVSVNYWKGMRYPLVFAGGNHFFIAKETQWLNPFIPTSMVGSIAIFDLRDPSPDESLSPERAFNIGLRRRRNLAGVRSFISDGKRSPESDRFINETFGPERYFRDAIRMQPDWPEAHEQLGHVLMAEGKSKEAAETYRRALALGSNSPELLNNLAWVLATGPDEVRNPAEAVRMAERACELTGRANLSTLDTLAQALAAAGRFQDAVNVCREGLRKSEKAQDEKSAAKFKASMEKYRQGT